MHVTLGATASFVSCQVVDNSATYRVCDASNCFGDLDCDSLNTLWASTCSYWETDYSCDCSGCICDTDADSTVLSGEGGGVFVDKATVHLNGTIFSSNTALGAGSALFYTASSSQSSLLDDCTFTNHVGVVIRIAGGTLEFVCSLGHYMPTTGDYVGGNFTGCAFLCDRVRAHARPAHARPSAAPRPVPPSSRPSHPAGPAPRPLARAGLLWRPD